MRRKLRSVVDARAVSESRNVGVSPYFRERGASHGRSRLVTGEDRRAVPAGPEHYMFEMRPVVLHGGHGPFSQPFAFGQNAFLVVLILRAHAESSAT